MQDKVSQLMGRVKAAPLSALLRVEGDVRRRATPERERVDFGTPLGQREHPYPVRLEEVNGVLHGPLAEPPRGSERLSRRLGGVASKVGDGRRGQIEALLDPLGQLDRERPQAR